MPELPYRKLLALPTGHRINQAVKKNKFKDCLSPHKDHQTVRRAIRSPSHFNPNPYQSRGDLIEIYNEPRTVVRTYERFKILNLFNFHVNKTKTHWLWSPVHNGYASLVINGHPMRAAWVSYLIFRGRIRGNSNVYRSCDVLACVNPDHLFLRTKKC